MPRPQKTENRRHRNQVMPELQCAGCDRQEERGCKAFQFREIEEGEMAEDGWMHPAYLPVTIDGEDIYHCPRQTIHEDGKSWGRLLQFYHLYTKGHLPDPGAVVDQCNATMEAFRILDAINSDIDAALAEKKRNKGPRDGNAGRN